MLFSRIPVIAIWNGRSKSVLGSFRQIRVNPAFCKR